MAFLGSNNMLKYIGTLSSDQLKNLSQFSTWLRKFCRHDPAFYRSKFLNLKQNNSRPMSFFLELEGLYKKSHGLSKNQPLSENAKTAIKKQFLKGLSDDRVKQALVTLPESQLQYDGQNGVLMHAEYFSQNLRDLYPKPPVQIANAVVGHTDHAELLRTIRNLAKDISPLKTEFPYNSRSNSRIERTFRSVSERIRVYQLADNGLTDLSIILAFVQAELNATPIGDSMVCPTEVILGYTPKQFLLEPLPPHTVSNLQGYAKANYHRLLQLSNCIDAHYGHVTQSKNVPNNDKLYPIGSKVRIIKNYPRGINKFQKLKYSKEIYTVKEHRPATRSYLLEHEAVGRRPITILVHHRRTKKCFSRPSRLCTPTATTDTVPNVPVESGADFQPDSGSSPSGIVTRAGRTIKRPKFLLHFES